MNLHTVLEYWDGKSVAELENLYDQQHQQSTFIKQLLESIDQPALQSGATWLLKKHLEGGGILDKKQTRDLFQNLLQLEHWLSKLHLLQILPYLTIDGRQKKRVEKFLRNMLMENNKFVRAWAYNGFHVLASQHPEYRQETTQLLEMALRDEAPSVKSRIRNIK